MSVDGLWEAFAWLEIPAEISPVYDSSLEAKKNRENGHEFTPELQKDAANAVWKLSQDASDVLGDKEVSKFNKILKENLPPEAYKFLDSLTPQDIALIISVIVICIGLIASWFGTSIMPSFIARTLGTRFAWALMETLYTGIVRMIQYEKSTSALFWVIPWMKTIAPNQWIALSANIFKDIAMTWWGWFFSSPSSSASSQRR